VRLILSHVLGFWRYYASSVSIRLDTHGTIEGTRSRLLALNESGDVHVRFTRRGELFMFATAHARASRGTPIVPVLRGKLRQQNDRVLLEGKQGLEEGTRLFLAFFSAVLIVIMIDPGGKVAFPGATVLAFAFFLFFLICGYAMGREDSKVIHQALHRALKV
jgi:hypothetical protein